MTSPIAGSSASRDSKAVGRWLIFFAVGALLAVGLGSSPTYDAPLDAYGYGLRVTARISFTFFMLAYLARPLQDLFGAGGWLLRHRRYLGLAAAFAHTVHFAYIVLHTSASGKGVDPVTVLAGGGAFVLLWLMALTSNDLAVRALGRWWKRLHRIGIHYVWAIFVYTFAGAALFAPWYWLFVAIGGAGLLMRVIARRRPPEPAPAGQSP